MPRDARQLDPALVYLLFATSVGVLALAGYAGYRLFPRFALPAVTGPALLALAAGAGIASFFSPCSFPLLATLLARETGGVSPEERLPRALGFAAALAVGASAFLLLTGAGIALGAGVLFARVTFTSGVGRLLRLVVGALLLLLGLMQLGWLPTNLFGPVVHVGAGLKRAQGRVRQRHPWLGFGVFGFGYLLAGFG